MTMLSQFKGSIAYTLISFAVAALIAPQGDVLGTLWIVAVLSVLEVSLSLDNAVVNAKVMANMSEIWRARFLTWGMLIAVVGMRGILPVAIGSATSGIDPWTLLHLAIHDEHRYAQVMEAAHPLIAAFGGAFLMLVALAFFVDHEKELHWLPAIENPLAAIARWSSPPTFGVRSILIGVTLLTIACVSRWLPPTVSWPFMVAGLIGVVSWVLVDALGNMFKVDEAPGAVAKQGLAGFLYLNVLDAAFSFDGVVGAFALTSKIFVILIGLGIGAMFVRSMTIYLVRQGTLAEYRYLEHGAFWAIAALAGVMLASPIFHIPEAVTGLIGAFFIGAALLNSVVSNRRAAAAQA